ncbi:MULTISPECIES: type I-E CRISPR-associated protein Cse2/CasB [unclassified Streptomyces]|uniref:type I-E CRISPR-associated protein Cse2/CasB n=1 Tax=unclassified Streptomyces TaxID=2593676 RepID=UPI003440919B
MSTATTGPASPGDAPPGKRHPRLEGHDAFVRAVRTECRVPGSQQALRHALGKPVDEVPARTHAVLLRNGLLPDGTKGDARRAHYAVAALIAARPRAERVADQEPQQEQEKTEETAEPNSREASSGSADLATQKPKFKPGGTSLGESLALATIRRDPDSVTRGEAGSDTHKVSGLESRLHLMARQDLDGIHRMLPSVMRQLGSAEVPIDYACLLNDLTAWRWYRGSVTTRWLTDYYRSLNHERAVKAKGKEAQKPVPPNQQ